MRSHLSISICVLVVATVVACESGTPPVLAVTSPMRSLVQSETGQLTVTGTAMPGVAGDDLAGATSQVLGFQTDSLSKLLITIPVPAIDGIQLTNLSLGADSGYVMVSGQIQ